MHPINTSKSQFVYTILLAALAWFAILLQLYLTTGSIINFFSYFTILSNLLVACSLTVCLLFPQSTAGVFFSKLSVQTAITLYIFIVGLVYNLVLRGLVPLQGWGWMVDNLLHVAVPVFYVLYWLLYRTRGRLKWSDGLYWTLFPLAYLMYSLLRGAATSWYPYPFLNAHTFGYPKVMVNVVVMIAAFFIVGLALIALNNFLSKGKQVAAAVH